VGGEREKRETLEEKEEKLERRGKRRNQKLSRDGGRLSSFLKVEHQKEWRIQRIQNHKSRCPRCFKVYGVLQ
jgi:hypothetical protein